MISRNEYHHKTYILHASFIMFKSLDRAHHIIQNSYGILMSSNLTAIISSLRVLHIINPLHVIPK